MGEAKGYVFCLKPFEVAENLVTQMIGHADTMKTLYKKVCTAVQADEAQVSSSIVGIQMTRRGVYRNSLLDVRGRHKRGALPLDWGPTLRGLERVDPSTSIRTFRAEWGIGETMH